MIQKSGFHFEKEGPGPYVVMNDRPAVLDDTNDMEVSEDEMFDDQDDTNDKTMDLDDTDQTEDNIRQHFRDSDSD